eukprot:TRINITY_DN14714_c2_g1_i1.p1 TRINITY_DN14714_c2_g1~~TRINITY_DN14714_c2_g1_i1.p1  ORF type:complete len:154 (+),score=17.98 TRINITY_DN14714_c2_g1_i1:65-463(+)
MTPCKPDPWSDGTTYAEAEVDLGELAADQQGGLQPPASAAEEICWDFKRGTCVRGTQCSWAHAGENTRRRRWDRKPYAACGCGQGESCSYCCSANALDTSWSMGRSRAKANSVARQKSLRKAGLRTKAGTHL